TARPPKPWTACATTSSAPPTPPQSTAATRWRCCLTSRRAEAALHGVVAALVPATLSVHRDQDPGARDKRLHDPAERTSTPSRRGGRRAFAELLGAAARERKGREGRV